MKTGLRCHGRSSLSLDIRPAVQHVHVLQHLHCFFRGTPVTMNESSVRQGLSSKGFLGLWLSGVSATRRNGLCRDWKALTPVSGVAASCRDL